VAARVPILPPHLPSDRASARAQGLTPSGTAMASAPRAGRQAGARHPNRGGGGGGGLTSVNPSCRSRCTPSLASLAGTDLSERPWNIAMGVATTADVSPDCSSAWGRVLGTQPLVISRPPSTKDASSRLSCVARSRLASAAAACHTVVLSAGSQPHGTPPVGVRGGGERRGTHQQHAQRNNSSLVVATNHHAALPDCHQPQSPVELPCAPMCARAQDRR
jgi:hypothetical protein